MNVFVTAAALAVLAGPAGSAGTAGRSSVAARPAPSIFLSLSASSNAPPGPLPGQTFTATLSYSWSGASAGQHSLMLTAQIPSSMEFVSGSGPFGPNQNGFISYQTGFNTTVAGPFGGSSSNVSGSGSISMVLRFKQGVAPGTNSCLNPGLSESGTSAPQTNLCIQAGGTSGGGGTNVPPANHWGMTTDLVDGIGLNDAAAIFRVAIVNSAPATPGEVGQLGPSLQLSVGSSGATIAGVGTSAASGSPLPPGWTIGSGLNTGTVIVNGTPVAPMAPLPVLFVRVKFGASALGSVTTFTSALTYRASSNPNLPLTLNGMKEVRLVVVPK